jgi:hypothetical protein
MKTTTDIFQVIVALVFAMLLPVMTGWVVLDSRERTHAECELTQAEAEAGDLYYNDPILNEYKRSMDRRTDSDCVAMDRMWREHPELREGFKQIEKDTIGIPVDHNAPPYHY